MNQDKELRGRLALNRLLAILALVCAMLCLHYAYTAHGWQVFALGAGAGWLCSVTITRTLKASIYAAALLAEGLITETGRTHR